MDKKQSSGARQTNGDSRAVSVVTRQAAGERVDPVESDPITDILIRIRNGIQRGLFAVEVPSSSLKVEVADILKAHGFISGYRRETRRNSPVLVIELRFPELGLPVDDAVETRSRLGRRVEFRGPFATKDDVRKIIDEEESLLADAPPLKVDLYDVLVETVNRSLESQRSVG